MKTYDVLVRYRTKSGCNARVWRVAADDISAAIDIACDQQRRQRGVIRIDGGETGKPVYEEE